MITLRASAVDSDLSPSPCLFLTIAKPAGIQVGDFLVATIAYLGPEPPAPFPTYADPVAPDGWTLLARVKNPELPGANGWARLLVYWKWAQDEPAKWVWSTTDHDFNGGIVRAYANVDPVAPILDDASGAVTTAGVTHQIPAVFAAADNALLVASMVTADGFGGGAYTTPSGWTSVKKRDHAGTALNHTTQAFDKQRGVAGQEAATNCTYSVNAYAATHVLALRPAPESLRSIDDVNTTLIDMLPPGVRSVYDFDGDIGKFYRAMAGVGKAHGFDLIDRLRRESMPPLAVENLADWEGIIGLASTAIAQFGTEPQRQQLIAAVMSTIGYTRANILLSGLVYLLGLSTVPTVVECDRSALYTANSEPFTGIIGAGGITTVALVVSKDSGLVRSTGAQLKLVITHPSAQDILYVTLRAPSGTTKTWYPVLSGAYSGQAIWLYAPSMAGQAASGTWTITIGDIGSAGGTIDTGSLLFAEAYLGGPAFEWGVMVKFSELGSQGVVDLVSALLLLRRLSPAHMRADVLLSDTGGAVGAIPDEAWTIPDMCIPG